MVARPRGKCLLAIEDIGFAFSDRLTKKDWEYLDYYYENVCDDACQLRKKTKFKIFLSSYACRLITFAVISIFVAKITNTKISITFKKL
jgi:hypothetical protein